LLTLILFQKMVSASEAAEEYRLFFVY